MIKFNDLHHQYLSIKPEIDNAISQIIEKSSFIGGTELNLFEENFAIYHEAKYCLGVANGTDALEIAIESLDLKPGSEIIVPANSWISSAECVLRAGHRIIFCDVSDKNYTLDIDDLTNKINQNTSAVIAVHLYGHPCNMNKIVDLCKKNNIRIIEDCAQAHGALYNKKKVGTFGDLGCFSFYPGKNLGAYGDGGCIITNNHDLFIKSKKIANHGALKKHDHELAGRNSRLDTMQAAILNVKLKYLDEWTMDRNNVANMYQSYLKNTHSIALPISEEDVFHAYHLFVIRVSNRDDIKSKLSDMQIETAIHYPTSLPKLKAFKHLNQFQENLFANRSDQNLLSLPIGSHLTKDHIETICDGLNRIL
tara:strand:+ start:329 stop:1423 length:1095 start_codon:yes stop_codon:yes gene_type:complete